LLAKRRPGVKLSWGIRSAVKSGEGGKDQNIEKRPGPIYGVGPRTEAKRVGMSLIHERSFQPIKRDPGTSGQC